MKLSSYEILNAKAMWGRQRRWGPGRNEKQARDGNLLRCHFRGFASLSFSLENGALENGTEEEDSALSSERKAE